MSFYVYGTSNSLCFVIGLVQESECPAEHRRRTHTYAPARLKVNEGLRVLVRKFTKDVVYYKRRYICTQCLETHTIQLLEQISMATPSTWLVTGASRGIGLEYVRQILARGDIVFATARSPEKAVELRRLQTASAAGSIEIVELDVRDPKSVANAAKVVESILQNRGLDYLISNAGIVTNPTETPSTIKVDDLMDVFQTNVIGNVFVYQNFLPLLERSKRPGGPVLVNMSSGLGSISRLSDPAYRTRPAAAGYSISKAALNMLTAKQACEKPNIIVLAIGPGWLKTDSGGPNALYDVDFSVNLQLNLIVAAAPADSGKFKAFNGTEITEHPW